MATIFTPETSAKPNRALPGIFLGGSIEMGKATNWQDAVSKSFGFDEINIFNPRRESWDSTWVQSIDNPIFRDQVLWELNNIELADCLIMFFQPETLSPISLLEFGVEAGRVSAGQLNKTIVCCPPGFWRKGNVDITAKLYNIPVVETVEELIVHAAEIMKRNFERRGNFKQKLG